MGFIRKWIQALSVPVDEVTGAIRVKADLDATPNIDIGDVNLLNVAGEKIDPATKESTDAIATALGTPAQAGEADAAADLIIAALGSAAQAGEADAAADLIILALGSPAQAGEAATAAGLINAVLNAPAQAGEAGAAADLIVGTGGTDLDAILAALGATGSLAQIGEAAAAASDIIDGIAGAGASTATLYDVAAALCSPLSINFDVGGTPMIAAADTGGAGTFAVLKTSLYAKPPVYPGTECGPLSASIIDALSSTLGLNITEYLLNPTMGDYQQATCSQVDFGGVYGYAKNVELCAREYDGGGSLRLSCTSTDDMLHFDGRAALNVIPMTFETAWATHQALNTYGGAVGIAGSNGLTFTPLLCDAGGQLLVGDGGWGGNGLGDAGGSYLKQYLMDQTLWQPFLQTIRDGRVATNTYTQMTEPGDALPFTIGFAARDHAFAVTVAEIDTDVVVKFQATMDGVAADAFDLMVTDTATGTSAVQHTITSNGTYQFVCLDNPLLVDVRPVFVSESGGDGSVTLDIVSRHVR